MAPRNTAIPAASTPLSPPASPSPPSSPNRRNASKNNKNNGNNNNTWWHPSVLERTVAYVKQDFENIVAASPFLQTAEPKASHIALFSRHEIITSKHPLAKGGFSCVYEIIDLVLDANITAKLSPEQAQLRQQYQQQVTEASSSSSSSSCCRFVLKHLQERLLAQPKAFCCAASDLAVEAAYMSTLDHEYICKVRGLPIQGLDAFASCCSNLNHHDNNTGRQQHRHDGYFIILDRLHDTLDQCIEKEQQEHQLQQKKKNLLMNNNSNSSSNTNSTTTMTTRLSLASLEKKTQRALQIAQALRYLHERRIVFRDLKPSNIGLDQHGNIQLFDFGLCRELPPSTSTSSSSLSSLPSSLPLPFCLTPTCNNNNNDDHDDNHDFYNFCCPLDDDLDHHHETGGGGGGSGGGNGNGYCDEVFEMSGVGTRRYMAVEIINTRRYNCKVDVYSWGMVVYEMLTLQKPFATYSVEDHQLFCCQNGERPSLHQRLLYKTTSTSNTNISNTSSSANSSSNNNQQHESSSLAVRKMIATVLEQSWCESVCNRFDIHQVCQAITVILRELTELSNKKNNNNISNNNDNSIGSSTSVRRPISVAAVTASASAKPTSIDKQPDSPVGVNDIRLLFPLALEYYHQEDEDDSGNSGGGDYYDNDSGDQHDSSSLVTADFRDDAPTSTMERQGQEILLLKKKKLAPPSLSSSAQGAAGIPSHLFLPDIQPLLLSHNNNNEEDDDDEHDDQDADDDDDERENDTNDDVPVVTGGILYRQSSYGNALA